MSLIGAAIAGGLQGGGEAAKASLGSMQDAVQKEELTRLANKLDEQKQMRIQANNQQFLSAQASEDRTFRTSERLGNEKFLSTQQQGLFAHQEKVSSEDRASREKIAAANDRTSKAVAGIHAASARSNMLLSLSAPHMQMLADGSIGMVSNSMGKDGKWSTTYSPVNDASGQPIKGPRTMTDAMKLQVEQYGRDIQDANKALVKISETGIVDPKNPEIVRLQKIINNKTQLQNVIFGKEFWNNTTDSPDRIIAELKDAKGSAPPADQIKAVLDTRQRMFQQTFGVEQANKWRAEIDKGLSFKQEPSASSAKPDAPASAPNPRASTPVSPEPKGLIADKLKFGGFGESNRSRGSRDPAPYQAKFDSGIAAYEKMPEATPRQRSAKLAAASKLEEFSGYLTADQQARAALLKDDLTRLSR
jgi:hypothetical protein